MSRRSKRSETRGRKPVTSDSGERLRKVSVLIFPERWSLFGRVVGATKRSEILREAMEERIANAIQEDK